MHTHTTPASDCARGLRNCRLSDGSKYSTIYTSTQYTYMHRSISVNTCTPDTYQFLSIYTCATNRYRYPYIYHIHLSIHTHPRPLLPHDPHARLLLTTTDGQFTHNSRTTHTQLIHNCSKTTHTQVTHKSYTTHA